MTAVLQALLGGAAGAVVALLGVLWSTSRQHHYQVERDAAAARREYAWRAEEHFRPYFYEALSVARAAITASNQTSSDVGDITALDRCIDRFESATLTAELAGACSEMRVQTVQFRALVGVQKRLSDALKESTAGASLDPSLGGRVADHGSDVEAKGDRLRESAVTVRHAVRDVVSSLERMQQAG